jgi:hypothetical protein
MANLDLNNMFTLYVYMSLSVYWVIIFSSI